MGNFSVSALCDVCREVHTMHNKAVDSVDYTRVYTICEDVSARVWLLYTQTVVNIWVCVRLCLCTCRSGVVCRYFADCGKRIESEFGHLLFTLNMFKIIIGRGRGLFNMRLVKEYGLYYARDSNKGSFNKFSAQWDLGFIQRDILLGLLDNKFIILW